jgi:hypothetical protein
MSEFHLVVAHMFDASINSGKNNFPYAAGRNPLLRADFMSYDDFRMHAFEGQVRTPTVDTASWLAI